MKNININEIKSFAKKIGADTIEIQMLVNEKSKSWTFYWKGTTVTFSNSKCNSRISYKVYVPYDMRKETSCTDCTGRAFMEFRSVIRACRNKHNNIKVIVINETANI